MQLPENFQNNFPKSFPNQFWNMFTKKLSKAFQVNVWRKTKGNCQINYQNEEIINRKSITEPAMSLRPLRMGRDITAVATRNRIIHSIPVLWKFRNSFMNTYGDFFWGFFFKFFHESLWKMHSVLHFSRDKLRN